MVSHSSAEFFGSLGPVSQVVLFVLFLFSVVSWAIILYKWWSFRTVEREDRRFLSAQGQSRDPEELRRHARRYPGSSSAIVFLAVLDRLAPERDGLTTSSFENAAFDLPSEPPSPDRQYVDRAVAYIVQNQVAKQESYLPFLATTGNITPFIGLLGTVLGIIEAFHEIGKQGTASIAAVAPGVSEALIATAAGLFTAIPAVIAYNYFLSRIRKAAFRLEAFSVEVINAVQAHAKQAGVRVGL